MLIVDTLSDLLRDLPYPVMSIGAFDGVHRGHQSILTRLTGRARERRGTSILLTFDPHPQKVIRPERAPLLLQTRRQKEEMIRRFGIDVLIRLAFNRQLSLFTPERFAREILYDHNVREIHVGGNFRFGHRREGDIDTLKELGEQFGFQVHQVEPVCFRGGRVSSTRIRRLLSEGRVAPASRLLSRPYQLSGTVIRGDRKGSELGFPTANLEVQNDLIPAPGVYVTRIRVEEDWHDSVTNIGFRPTLHRVSDDSPVVETHLLDFEGNLYGRQVRLNFCRRLRSERRFPDVETLRDQIARDVRKAREYFSRTARLRKEES